MVHARQCGGRHSRRNERRSGGEKKRQTRSFGQPAGGAAEHCLFGVLSLERKARMEALGGAGRPSLFGAIVSLDYAGLEFVFETQETRVLSE